jgi:hypothetical protein
VREKISTGTYIWEPRGTKNGPGLKGRENFFHYGNIIPNEKISGREYDQKIDQLFDSTRKIEKQS